MKKNKADFPHPVLFEGSDDYIDASFGMTVNHKDTDKTFDFRLSYELTSDMLSSMVESGQAKVVTRVHSPFAAFRNTQQWDSSSKNHLIRLNKHDLARYVEFETYIIAKEDIEDFQSAEHRKDYFGNFKYSVSKGDVLAITDVERFYLDASELEKPMSSLVSIAQSVNDNTEFKTEVDLHEDKITIHLDRKTYDTYLNLRRRKEPMIERNLIGLIVYPATVEAISHIIRSINEEAGESEEFKEKRWFRGILKKLKDLGIEQERIKEHTATSLADRLLGYVTASSVRNLDAFVNEYEEDIDESEFGSD